MVQSKDDSYDIVSLGFDPVELLPQFLKLYPSDDPNNPSYSLRNVDVSRAFCPRPSGCKDAARLGQPELNYQTMDGIRQLPKAKHYVLFHVLATQPNKELAKALLQQAVRQAECAVWIRTPSFEVDAAAVIAPYELRLAWTTWTMFTCKFTLDELLSWLSPEDVVDYRAINWIRSSDDEKVVPVTAPPDTLMFDGRMGYKFSTKFDPPVPSEYEIVVINS